MSADLKITDRKCPKCKKGQPLYERVLKPGKHAFAREWLLINVEVVVYECIRCRKVYR